MQLGVVWLLCAVAWICAAIDPPHLKPLPPLAVGEVKYPPGYVRPIFRRSENLDLVTAITTDLEDAGVDVDELGEKLKQLFHQDSSANSIADSIVAEAKRKTKRVYAHNSTTSAQSFRVRPPTGPAQLEETSENEQQSGKVLTPQEILEKMKAELPLKLKELEKRLQVALSIYQSHQRLALGEIEKLADKVHDKHPKLYDEFSEALVRERKLWDNVLRRIEEKFEDMVNFQKGQVPTFSKALALAEQGVKNGQESKTSMNNKFTLRTMFDLCKVDNTPITEQLKTLFPPGKRMPMSAHPHCWCEGRLQQAYMQRTAFVDYHYNNYQALRHCLENNCWLCHSVFEAVWIDLWQAVDPAEICNDYAENHKFPLSSRESAFEDCKLLTAGFVSNFYGIFTRASELLGGVAKLAGIKDCVKEFDVFKANGKVVAKEVCYVMDCCKVGTTMTQEQVESFQQGLKVD